MASQITLNPGIVPTTFPVEYSVVTELNITSISGTVQPQVFVSHQKNFQLWGENETVSHALKKFVMTGGTRSMKQDLSDAFTNNLVTDFVVTHQLLENQHPIQEHLVLQRENPFVSFAARIGNSSTLLFTGISGVQFCSGDQGAGAGVGVGGDTDLCSMWYENIISPLYLYSMENFDTMGSNADENTDTNSTTSTTTTQEIIKRVEGIDAVGFITFNVVHNDNGNTTNTTQVIDDHMKKMKRKRLSIAIVIVLATIAVFVIIRMWTTKRQEYQRVE